jgi:hypothetical protein
MLPLQYKVAYYSLSAVTNNLVDVNESHTNHVLASSPRRSTRPCRSFSTMVRQHYNLHVFSFHLARRFRVGQGVGDGGQEDVHTQPSSISSSLFALKCHRHGWKLSYRVIQGEADTMEWSSICGSVRTHALVCHHYRIHGGVVGGDAVDGSEVTDV